MTIPIFSICSNPAVPLCFQLDFLRSPVQGRTADFMVAPDSVDKARQVLHDAGIEYHVSTLDMQRYVNLRLYL